ncbi:MAG TPA: hypothetical protein VGT41_04920 [Candidatus Babeliales bacterium]|nr:hypothetical protein [Candidatus Babeliales bacterium]
MQFYERYTFLEFFDREEVIELEASILRYIMFLEDGSIFSLYFSLHEGYAAIKLGFNNTDKSIFEISINGLNRISCTDDSLCFFKRSKDIPFPYQDLQLKEPFLIVRVKPTVSFQCDI